MFKKVQDRDLVGLIVWVPMVKGDSALEAAELISPEKRLVMQAWDARRAIGEALARTLKLKCPAWDVYLVYEPGVRWDGDKAPIPKFWMHQLGDYSGADPSLHLQPAVLENEIRNLMCIKQRRTVQ